MNKIDGVDSYDEFIAPSESMEDKYIHRNYEARDQNEHLTFHIPLSLFLFVCPLSLSLFVSLSGVGTAAGYMKTIHHCIFTIKLLTERRLRSYIGQLLQGWTKRKVTCENIMRSTKQKTKGKCLWVAADVYS